MGAMEMEEVAIPGAFLTPWLRIESITTRLRKKWPRDLTSWGFWSHRALKTCSSRSRYKLCGSVLLVMHTTKKNGTCFLAGAQIFCLQHEGNRMRGNQTVCLKIAMTSFRMTVLSWSFLTHSSNLTSDSSPSQSTPASSPSLFMWMSSMGKLWQLSRRNWRFSMSS